MSVLVTYASMYGATEEIATRVAETLREAGQEVQVLPVQEAGDVTRFDAFVIGSAVYFGAWLKDAVKFVEQNQATLSTRPVWLFSSGPVGAEARQAAERGDPTPGPKKLPEVMTAIAPHGHHGFYGALDRDRLKLGHKILAALPASRNPWAISGDLRNWSDIEQWAAEIARAFR